MATKPAKAFDRRPCAAMSRSGRFVIVAEQESSGCKVELVDALGTAPRRHLTNELPIDFAMIGEAAWLLTADRLIAYSQSADELASIEVKDGLRLSPSLHADGYTAVVRTSAGNVLATLEDGSFGWHDIADELSRGEVVTSLHGHGVLAVSDRTYSIGLASKGVESSGALPDSGRAIAAAEILGGKAFAIMSSSKSGGFIDVIGKGGSLIHHIEVPDFERLVFADIRGMAFGYANERLVAVDLRYGRILHTANAPLEPVSIAIDAEARHLLISGYQVGAPKLSVFHIPFSDAFGRTRPSRASDSVDDDDDGNEASAEVDAVDAVDAAGENSGPATDPSVPEEAEPSAIEIPDGPLLGLRNDKPLSISAPTAHAEPYSRASEHLDDLLDLVVARCAFAIANAWDSGELSQPLTEGLPFEKEVRALVGHRAGAAPKAVADAEQATLRISKAIGARTAATAAVGTSLPLLEIIRQFELTPVAAEILPIVAAPSLRRQAARLFGVLANDSGRPICDRALVTTILSSLGEYSATAIKAELESTSPLIRAGLLRVGVTGISERLFAGLASSPSSCAAFEARHRVVKDRERFPFFTAPIDISTTWSHRRRSNGRLSSP